MDFVSDGLADGRRLRCLGIVDDCTRECLALEVDTSITGTRVKAVLERLADARGLPRSITVDHGPEFEGQVLDAWAYHANVQLSFIRPGKPNENAYIESFNGKFRDECLNGKRLANSPSRGVQIIRAYVSAIANRWTCMHYGPGDRPAPATNI
jgi:putative transposase